LKPLVALLVAQVVLGLGVVVAASQDFFGIGQDAEPARTAAIRLAADRFDAGRAFRLIEQQVALGPRPAGSEASRALGDRLVGLLPRGRFEALGPTHPGLRNVVGSIAGRGKAIVVGAHYDTEATIPGHVGANDGAAGTAAVVEIARALKRDRRLRPRSGRPVVFVLFDGEEEPPGGDGYVDGLRGSRAYVRAHRGRTGDMVLLDYIANKGARFRREGGSNRELWERLRTAARGVGAGALFPAGTQPRTIYDDHTSFTETGVRAIDVIDFDYEHRDTTRDTPDKLSRAELDGVGESVLALTRGL